MTIARSILTACALALCACGQGDPTPIADVGVSDLGYPDIVDMPTVEDVKTTDVAVEDVSDEPEMDVLPSGPWRSALYPENWLPGATDEQGRAIPDFSYAGFRRGEAPWKDPEPYISLADFGPDPSGITDSSSAFEAAISAVSRGGTLVIGPGIYRMERPLEIRDSGVLIQGNGRPQLYFPDLRAMNHAPISFIGSPKVQRDLTLTQDAPEFSEIIFLPDVQNFQIGDRVWLGHVVTEAFAAEYRAVKDWEPYLGEYQVIHRRTVAEVDVGSSLLRLDVPIRQPLKVRDGATLQHVSNELERVGIRSVSIATAQNNPALGASSPMHAILFRHVLDGLVDDVNSFSPPNLDSDHHLFSGGILVEDSSLVTVANSNMQLPQNREAGHGQLFEVRRSNEILFRNVAASGGGFNFIQAGGMGTSGIVWLGVTSTSGPSGFGDLLAGSNLVDSSTLDATWVAGEQPATSQNVFWNTAGTGTIRSIQIGWGYVIGTQPELRLETSSRKHSKAPSLTFPEDWVEGQGRGNDLVPSSLYEDQVRRRLQN